MCTFWYVWESMCIVFWKRVEIIVYILKEMEINFYFWDGWKSMCTFERIRNQCVRWRSIYSFCGNGNSHRDQRGDLPRLVDVDNVWGTKYLNFKNNQYTARWKSPKILCFCLYFLVVRRVMRRGDRNAGEALFCPSSPSRHSAPHKTR